MAIAAGFAKRPQSVFESHVKTLKEQGVDWPTATTREFVERRIAHWGDSPGRFECFVVEDIFEAISPWEELPDLAEAGIDDDCGAAHHDPIEFDPLQPCMAAVKGSVREKSREFRSMFIKRMLTPAVRGGSDLAQGCEVVCEVSIKQLTNINSIDDGCGDTICEVLRVTRLVLSMVKSRLVPPLCS